MEVLNITPPIKLKKKKPFREKVHRSTIYVEQGLVSFHFGKAGVYENRVLETRFQSCFFCLFWTPGRSHSKDLYLSVVKCYFCKQYGSSYSTASHGPIIRFAFESYIIALTFNVLTFVGLSN